MRSAYPWYASAALLLSACGGSQGGGGGNPSPPASFTVGGTVTGLNGTLVLQNNAGGNLSLTANGAFTFATRVTSGGPFVVTVLTQPTRQECSVANGSGTATANITNVAVTCVNPPPPPQPTLGSRAIKELTLTWNAVAGATHYRVLEDGTGNSGFVQVSGDIPAAQTQFGWIAPLHLRLNARVIVQSCTRSLCTDSATLSVSNSVLSAAVGYFKASNTEKDDGFGAALALSGDGNTLAIGAPSEDSLGQDIAGQANNNAASSGAVYLFVRAGNTWTQQAMLKASNVEPTSLTNQGDRFGSSLAISVDGNTVAVGAPRESSAATALNGDSADDSAGAAGAAYIFVRSGTAWTQQAYIKATDTAAFDNFGSAVALSGNGNLLAVGAPFEDSNARGVGGEQLNTAAKESGAVYTYRRAGSTWTPQSYLKSSNSDTDDLFGDSLALSSDGTTLAVSARHEASAATGANGDQTDNSLPFAGAVFVFIANGNTWTQQAYLKASNTNTGDNFGFDLALSTDGSTLAVCAPGEDSQATGIGGAQADNTISASGAVYVFTRSGTSWAQQAYVKASNTGPGDSFGESASLSGDGNTLVVGARFESSNATGIGGDQTNDAASSAGAVYLFTRASGVWVQRSYVKAPNTDTGDFLGFAVDLAADGLTLAVTAPLEDGATTGVGGDASSNAGSDSGAAYVY